MALTKLLLLIVLVISLPVHGAAQTAQDVNESNNPLTPKLGVNLQDAYVSSFYDLDSQANTILLRGVLPHKLFGWPQLLRATVPIVTSPDEPLDSRLAWATSTCSTSCCSRRGRWSWASDRS